MCQDLHLSTEYWSVSECRTHGTVWITLSTVLFLTSTKMSGDSPVTSSFAVADYVVFALMLVVSAAVGVYYAWADRGQRSSGDFLMGGRRLTALPVSLSLTASFMSAITVLSNPAEVRSHHIPRGQMQKNHFVSGSTERKTFLVIVVSLTFQVNHRHNGRDN